MSTSAQINANRINAQKSTGPKTEQGKSIVSKNAVKHGLFSNQALIPGETIDEFNLNREQLLEELNPVTKMELILAERIINLTWRLKRIERFQNIVIDTMIDRELNNPLKNLTKNMVPERFRKTEEQENNSDFVVGNAIVNDYSHERVLDRLSIYERRIENSLFKTINELKKMKMIRQLENKTQDISGKTEDKENNFVLNSVRAANGAAGMNFTHFNEQRKSNNEQLFKNEKQSQFNRGSSLDARISIKE